MTHVQIAVLCFTVTVILIAWTRGGHPERLGACTILIWMTVSIGAPSSLHQILIGRLPVLDILLEAALLSVFLGMALGGGRWWPFAASAVGMLSVLVYLALPFVPEFDRRAEISAHLGLMAALNLTLLGGVAERWLAGERPIGLAWWNSRPTLS